MYAATFCFLGVAVFIVILSAYLTMAKVELANANMALYNKPPTWQKNATWLEIKGAWTEWHVRCQEIEGLKAESNSFLGAHVGAMCCALHRRRPSRSGVWPDHLGR